MEVILGKPFNSPDDDCWPENRVPSAEPSAPLVEELISILNDARDERPIQALLAANPLILRALLPPSRCFWCFDRPKFGNQYIPDFLICCQDSTGHNWTVVELESPVKTALNARGRMSSGLTEAIGQIHDWRIWLRKNIAYAHAELGFKDICAECSCIIIIGRRAQLNHKFINQYRELSGKDLKIITYDRLVDSAKSIAK
jgi:hypothetical protein